MRQLKIKQRVLVQAASADGSSSDVSVAAVVLDNDTRRGLITVQFDRPLDGRKAIRVPADRVRPLAPNRTASMLERKLT